MSTIKWNTVLYTFENNISDQKTVYKDIKGKISAKKFVLSIQYMWGKKNILIDNFIKFFIKNGKVSKPDDSRGIWDNFVNNE
jgi:hypothetical protein